MDSSNTKDNGVLTEETRQLQAEEDTLTMVDVLEQEDEEEAAAQAVLGHADDKNCTYSQGYMTRQPLYACRTCSKKPAGICLACSYHCHEGHDVIELYTKRKFRCDCGNSCFEGKKCTLDPFKDETNGENAYNHNFSGLYCTCERPYPDPEDDTDDVMTQCSVCEDWFHGRHLEGMNDEDLSNLDNIICHLCCEKLPFLTAYPDFESETESEDLKCKIEGVTLPATGSRSVKFCPDGWQKKLCRCLSCLEIYEKSKVMFLLDENDPISVFEGQDRNKALKESRHEREMRALSSLGHVQQVEVIQGYTDMKTALTQRLQEIASENKVVTEKDIRDFFDELQAKRRRLAVPPTSCR